MKTVLFFISLKRKNFSEQLEGVYNYNYSCKLNWHVQVIENPQSREQAREALADWEPCGVLAEYGEKAVFHDRKLFGDIPVVHFDIGRRPPKSGHFVSFDSASAGRMGADHLLNLNFRQYAYVPYWEKRLWDYERNAAFCSAIRETGAACESFSQDYRLAASHRHMKLQEWLRTMRRPCGIMAANDRVAEEVISACAKLGLSIPDDVAVLDVDNDRLLCENQRPTLSSVVPDAIREGWNAAEMLNRLIKNGNAGNGLEVLKMPPCSVCVRQSTRIVTCGRAIVREALEMIRTRATEGITVTDVVGQMGGISRRMAERSFRAEVGHSILEEIVNVRFEKVYELLMRPTVTIDSIAGRVGFKTEVALRKAFRLREGCSMRDWRNRHVLGDKCRKSDGLF